MQKSLKILSNMSSTSTFPVILPKLLVASLKSSAALSKSPTFFLELNFFKLRDKSNYKFLISGLFDTHFEQNKYLVFSLNLLFSASNEKNY